MARKKIRIVFMGTPQFAVTILEALVNNDYNVIGVITESDKPSGRRKEVIFPPVKHLALDKGLKVFQPETNQDLQGIIYKLQPDIVIVAAYGRILKKEILDLPQYGCLNIHPSLLPALRGPSPVQTAILQGLKITGVTIMKMDEGMDTGPIISREEIDIADDDTSSILFRKTARLGADLLLRILPKYIGGDLRPVDQGKKGVSYTKIIRKEDGHIDFKKSADEEERKFRAFDIWPGVFAFWNKKRVKFLDIKAYRAKESGKFHKLRPGEVFLDKERQLCIAFKKGYWVVKELQLEGRKKMEAEKFLNGYSEIIGDILK